MIEFVNSFFEFFRKRANFFGGSQNARSILVFFPHSDKECDGHEHCEQLGCEKGIPNTVKPEDDRQNKDCGDLKEHGTKK